MREEHEGSGERGWIYPTGPRKFGSSFLIRNKKGFTLQVLAPTRPCYFVTTTIHCRHQIIVCQEELHPSNVKPELHIKKPEPPLKKETSNVAIGNLGGWPLMFIRRAAVAFPRPRRFFSTNNVHDGASTIAELNQEMESVFGEPPPSGFTAGSINNDFAAQDQCMESRGLTSSSFNKSTVQQSQSVTEKMKQISTGLTHVGNTGEAQMVDVSPKEATKRSAVASCKVILGKRVFQMVLANQMAKGDVLTVAKIAGINGAKQTSSLIPLCHNITLTNVRVDLALNPDDCSVEVEGEAASTGKTGVEMEAMTAVTIAGLTVYDMCKAASKEIQITDIQLERKSGGKSGHWSRED